MIHIKKFIDRIASVEGRQSRDIVMSITDARALRDEIMKLMIENQEKEKSSKKDDTVIEVQLAGSKW